MGGSSGCLRGVVCEFPPEEEEVELQEWADGGERRSVCGSGV